MDGFNTTGDLVVIAASNLLEKLDPALLRPGPLRPPDLRLAARRRRPRGDPARPHAQQAARRRRPRAARPPDRRPHRRRPRQPLQRGGDLRRARRTATAIGQADFDGALERVVAGMQSRRTLNEHERRVVAFHEAGHALCAELLPGVDRVHKISIVPRGRALGYTLNLPEEDRYLKTREELIDYMTVLLGGRVAEELVFGAVTTGAPTTSRRVAEISRSMVHEYAMGTVDHVAHRCRPRAARCPTARASCATRSSSTSPTRRCAGAVRIITEHRDKLDAARAARCCATRCSSAATSTASWTACSARGCTACAGLAGLRVVAAHSDPRDRERWRQARPRRGADVPVKMGQMSSTRTRAGADRGRRLPRAARAWARSAPSSSRSSGSATCSRSATRASPASPRRPAWSRCRRTSRSPPRAGSGLRDDLEVACWAAMAEAGGRPSGRLLFVNVAPDALGHPGLLELADRCRRGS